MTYPSPAQLAAHAQRKNLTPEELTEHFEELILGLGGTPTDRAELLSQAHDLLRQALG